MANEIQMRVKRNNVSAWTARLRSRVATEVEASANRALIRAEEMAPKDTGALAASGRVIQLDEMEFAVRFGEGLPDGRAIYQELGTSTHPAQPYLYPALQEEAPNLVSRLAQTTQGRVTRMPAGGVSGSPEIVR